MSETPQRYTAELAGRIEVAWQDRWEEQGTFHAPNPSGQLSEPGRMADFTGGHLVVLDMFPYPSGAGLHVGHPLGYIATDVYSRFHRMLGKNVLHALGYDAFGLPAEQYAVRTGQHPRKTTEDNMVVMRRQLRRLGLGLDDRRSIETIDPGYYRWTQWIFRLIFESWYDPEAIRPDGSVGRARPISELVAQYSEGGRSTPDGRPWAELSAVEQADVVDGHRLAYVSEAPVNWCPGLGTVLSNEEVTNEGRSERGNFPVYRRNLRQWMMRITAYADRLADDLDRVAWPDKVKAMQRNWIGRSQGARVSFPVVGTSESIEVFTTRPDTLFGATFMVLAPEHPLLETIVPQGDWPVGSKSAWTRGGSTPGEAVSAYRLAASRRSEVERQIEGKDKTGVFTGAYATNPVTGTEVPVFVADYVLMGYGTGAIMAVPGQDQRDWDFAAAFELPVVRTVRPSEGHPQDQAFTGEGPAINSANDEISLDDLAIPEAKARIIAWLEDKEAGHGTVNYKLRDWLFSRQRYWGEPFPIVFDEDGVAHSVPESMLPVTLPDVPDYSPKTFEPDDNTSAPEPPLSRVPEWVEVELDLGNGRGPQTYRRETNTMPNWAGSCWYYLRYLDPTNNDAFLDPDNEGYWIGPRSETVAGAPAGLADPGGVDLYIGGVEHAVLHLLYARFWHKVLFDLGHVSSEEPFRTYFSQGYIQAFAYKDARGQYVEATEVQEVEGGDPHHPTFTWQGATGDEGVREDREVAAQRGEPGRDVRHLWCRHPAGLRDVDGSAGAVETVGDPRGRRCAALPATVVAQRDRRGDRSGTGGGRRAGRGDRARRGTHCRHRADRLRQPALQHGHCPDDRAEQRPDQAGPCTGRGSGGPGPDGRSAGTTHRRGALGATGSRRVPVRAPVPGGGPGAAGRGHRHVCGADQGQGPRPSRGRCRHQRGRAARAGARPAQGSRGDGGRHPHRGRARTQAGERGPALSPAVSPAVRAVRTLAWAR